ncbi:hypothetical protein [Hyalangium versicolor]|uniref:hypothetical protein n=1 Tax=Hyalangium versicolor TaxID=2861190 RepID=UPI001CCCB1AB|nr:hypothetical protein [Hyalangium versicolor]
MSHPSLVDIGAYINGKNLPLPPSAESVGERTSGAMDVSQYKSAVLIAFTGAATGAPSALSVTHTVQSRLEGSNAWVNVTDPDGNVPQVKVEAANTVAELDINLMWLPEDHSEIRIVEDTAFTGGTNPTVVGGAVLVLGGASRLPI